MLDLLDVTEEAFICFVIVYFVMVLLHTLFYSGQSVNTFDNKRQIWHYDKVFIVFTYCLGYSAAYADCKFMVSTLVQLEGFVHCNQLLSLRFHIE